MKGKEGRVFSFTCEVQQGEAWSEKLGVRDRRERQCRWFQEAAALRVCSRERSAGHWKVERMKSLSPMLCGDEPL